MEEFVGHEVTRIFIASNLNEAQNVEKLLTLRGIDYAIEIERYVRLSVFGTDAAGAAFYVSYGQGSFCRDLLREAGFVAGIVEEDM